MEKQINQKLKKLGIPQDYFDANPTECIEMALEEMKQGKFQPKTLKDVHKFFAKKGCKDHSQLDKQQAVELVFRFRNLK